MSKNKYSMLEQAATLGYCPKEGTDLEKAKAMGIDFKSATWKVDFVKDTYYKHGLVRASFMAVLLPTLKLGCYSSPGKSPRTFLEGVALGLYIADRHKMPKHKS